MAVLAKGVADALFEEAAEALKAAEGAGLADGGRAGVEHTPRGLNAELDQVLHGRDAEEFAVEPQEDGTSAMS
ncbi:MAG: hypothetical protein NTW86_02130 [Candidatus Sumerlaeota bacterium]|nr:hypothetical protein [Candidatus Sumerlaeota bacterium]